MSSHTPGPWVLDKAESGWLLLSNGNDITTEPFDCTDADARLMAAAPDLLSELKLCCAVLESIEFGENADRIALQDRVLLNALAAVSKAEGSARQLHGDENNKENQA